MVENTHSAPLDAVTPFINEEATPLAHGFTLVTAAGEAKIKSRGREFTDMTPTRTSSIANQLLTNCSPYVLPPCDHTTNFGN